MSVWDEGWGYPEVAYTPLRSRTTLGLIFLLTLGLVCSGKLLHALCLTNVSAVEHFEAWRLLSYGFTFDIKGATLLFFFLLMIQMYWFGRELETQIGGLKLAMIFLSATALGGVSWVLYQYASGTTTPAAGNMMAGPCALIMAAALFQPKKSVRYFFFVPTNLLLASLLSIAVAGIYVSAHYKSAAAAMPMAVAVLVTFGLFKLSPFFESLAERFAARLARLRANREDEMRREVDCILDKISRSGMASLSRYEMKLLKRASRALAEKYRD